MTDLIGQTIGNYQIEALLGKGGMGQVFRARHLRLNRSTAIKVIHAPLSSDATFRARFEDEASTAARLTHPNIITLYGYQSISADATNMPATCATSTKTQLPTVYVVANMVSVQRSHSPASR